MDKYSDHMIAKLQASGANAAAVQAQLQDLKKYKEMYENPLFNSLITFLEPFPIGLVISLLSSAVLRKTTQSQSVQSPLPAS